MKLFIKAFIIILMFQSFAAKAQEADSTASKRSFQFFVGYSEPFAFDDRFMGDAYRLQYGAEAGAAYIFAKNFLIGAQIDVLSTEVEDPEAVGGVQETRIISSSANLGYILNLMENLDISAKLGLGHVRYVNQAAVGKRFHDDAFITYIKPKLTYNIDKVLGVYLSFTFRRDNLNIETSDSYSEYFESSTRGALSLGVQFSI